MGFCYAKRALAGRVARVDAAITKSFVFEKEPPGLPTAPELGRAGDRLLLLHVLLAFLLLDLFGLVLLVASKDVSAVMRVGIQQNGETFAVGVLERDADVDPPVVFTFVLSDDVRTICGVPHGECLSL